MVEEGKRRGGLSSCWMDGLGIEEGEADEVEDEMEEEKVELGHGKQLYLCAARGRGTGQAREREGEKGQTSPRNCSVMGVGRGEGGT